MLTEVPYGRPPSLCIGPSSFEAMDIGFLGVAGVASAAWPLANLALFYPFSVSKPIVAVKMWLINGGTASGNFDIGIYNAAGGRLVSSGTTAQSGTTTIQVIDTTDLSLAANTQYYMALAMDGNVGTARTQTAGDAPTRALMGMAEMAAAFPLPATATYAEMGRIFTPLFGLSQLVTF